MRLKGSNNCLFTLRIERYEFPDEELGPTEDNPVEEFETGRFLIVSHRFRNTDGEWDAVGPTMTTTELHRFISWLDSVHKNKPYSDRVYFTERDLEFTVDAAVTVLRVHAFRDFLPEWCESDCVTIEFDLRNLDIAEAIHSLKEQLEQFPGRPTIEETS